MAGPTPKVNPNPTPNPTSQPGAAQLGLLFTAFEPSGDAHAAPVIAELRRIAPALRIYAWGGPRMQAAGATIIQATCDDGAMGLNAINKAMSMRREVARIKRWLTQYRIVAHVPVDSPAANFPICKITRAAGARIIHLVAPQLWAWGGWRIGKLRRLTDLVLCLLPFEEQWFRDRDVPAHFIGHPRVNRKLDLAALTELARELPAGGPRVAIFPGSRSQEVKANIKLLMNAFIELHGRHAGMVGLIVAANPLMARLVRQKVKVFPTGMHMINAGAFGAAEGNDAGAGNLAKTGSLVSPAAAAGAGAGESNADLPGVDAAIAWCDLALAVSGTVSLDIALQHKPMVGVYRTSLTAWLGSKLLLRTPFRFLPNIIAEREIVPEFVPHAGGPGPIMEAAASIIRDSKVGAIQAEELRRVCMRFTNHDPAPEAAKWIVKVIKEGKA